MAKKRNLNLLDNPEQSENEYDDEKLEWIMEELNKYNLTVTIDPKILEKADAKAERQGVTLDSVVEAGLKHWLKGRFRVKK